MKKIKIFLSAVTALTLACCFAGCSGGTENGGSSQSGQESASGSSDGTVHTMEELAQELSGYTMINGEYSVEGATPIDAKSIMSDKKIFILPGNYTVKFSQTTCDYIKAICDSMGIEATIFPTDGTTGKWVEGIETAINQKYSAILAFSGVTMEEISPQVQAANDAGIPVIDLHFHDFADSSSCSATYCLPAG